MVKYLGKIIVVGAITAALAGCASQDEEPTDITSVVNPTSPANLVTKVKNSGFSSQDQDVFAGNGLITPVITPVPWTIHKPTSNLKSQPLEHRMQWVADNVYQTLSRKAMTEANYELFLVELLEETGLMKPGEEINRYNHGTPFARLDFSFREKTSGFKSIKGIDDRYVAFTDDDNLLSVLNSNQISDVLDFENLVANLCPQLVLAYSISGEITHDDVGLLYWDAVNQLRNNYGLEIEFERELAHDVSNVCREGLEKVFYTKVDKQFLGDYFESSRSSEYTKLINQFNEFIGTNFSEPLCPELAIGVIRDYVAEHSPRNLTSNAKSKIMDDFNEELISSGKILSLYSCEGKYKVKDIRQAIEQVALPN
jgi:hypothetical protein